MGFEIEISGLAQVRVALATIAAQSSVGAAEAVLAVLNQIQRQQRTMLSLGWHKAGTKTGSVAPMPPWRITGHLSRSVTVERPRLVGYVWEGRVGPTAVYSRIHELGGWTGQGHRTYLPPRPSLKPAWALVLPTVPATFYRTLNRSMRRL